MPRTQRTFYGHDCDFPECEKFLEEPEFGMPLYTTKEHLSEILGDSEWYWEPGSDQTKYYCTQHRTVWESDLDDGDEPPAKPYLLILEEATAGYNEVRLIA